MTVTTKEQLGATTLNRKWYLDVNAGSFESPDWTGVFGMTEFVPKSDPTLQDDSDFDGGGYKSQTATALAWGVDGKVKRAGQSAAPTEYDPGQEILRIASLGMGQENRVDVRYYEVNPGGPLGEAWRGFAGVTWTEDGGGMDGLSIVSFTLFGQGQRTAITHPGADESSSS